MLEAQNKHFVQDVLKFSRFVATTFFHEIQIDDLKIDVSCEASVNFHHIPQTPRLPGNLHVVTTSRSNAIRKNTQRDV